MLRPEQYMLFMKHFNEQFGFKYFPILWEAVIEMCTHECCIWH